MKGKWIKYSQQELDFIKANRRMTRATLTKAFNSRFNRDVAVDNIKALCNRRGWHTGITGCFEKGNEPWNKGKNYIAGGNSVTLQAEVEIIFWQVLPALFGCQRSF